MNRETLETFAVWGDRENRDTAMLLDIAVAGTIDHLRGHGSVRLLPARLEEIVGRIAPRVRDEDGAWVVTLMPPGDDLIAVNPYDVLAFIHEKGQPTSDRRRHDRVAFVHAAAVPGATLRDLKPHYPEFVAWAVERYLTT